MGGVEGRTASDLFPLLIVTYVGLLDTKATAGSSLKPAFISGVQLIQI